MKRMRLAQWGVLLFCAAQFGGRCAPYVWAGFSASPLTWNGGYETDPTNTDSIAQADDHLRQGKIETRRRGEVEHDWGVFGNVAADTGRHLLGSARPFLQTTAPPVDGTITALCLPENDTAGHRGCDAGRLWVDSDGPDNIAGNADDNTIYVSRDSDADGDADSWAQIFLPQTKPLVSVAGTNTPTINITSGLTSQYKKYELQFYLVVSANTVVCVRVSHNGGATYDAGAGDYGYTVSSTTAITTIFSGSDSSICLIRNGTAAASNGKLGGTITLQNIAAGRDILMSWNAANDYGGGAYEDARGSGARFDPANGINAIQFITTGPNFTTASYAKLYGVPD